MTVNITLRLMYQKTPATKKSSKSSVMKSLIEWLVITILFKYMRAMSLLLKQNKTLILYLKLYKLLSHTLIKLYKRRNKNEYTN